MKHGLKLRHVEAFVEIARRGSLKEAADALALTQPAISKTLRELEERLGARLLDRDRSGVALTEAGKGFLPSAEASLGALRLGLARIDASRTAGPRRFAVGALPSVAARVLPAAALKIRAPCSNAYERRAGRRMSPPSGTWRLLFRNGANGKPVLMAQCCGQQSSRQSRGRSGV